MEGLGYQQQWGGMYLGTMGGVGKEPEEVEKVLGLLEKLEVEGCPLTLVFHAEFYLCILLMFYFFFTYVWLSVSKYYSESTVCAWNIPSKF